MNSSAGVSRSGCKTGAMPCRICHNEVEPLLDLGCMPPANWLSDKPGVHEQTFELQLEHCAGCTNLQLRYCLPTEVLYGHYFYSTPDSPSLERHYHWLIQYMLERGYANAETDLVEVGSNRGAFLKAIAPYVKSTLGIDPARNIVEIAVRSGVETVCDYFNATSAKKLAASGKRPSLIVARHCMAHNEYPQEMLAGAAELLAPDGMLVVENNYAGKMIEDGEFDQIYHEHMFYYSLSSLGEMLKRSGFRPIDVALTAVHGGSIVCFAVPQASSREATTAVSRLVEQERATLGPEKLRRFAERTYVIRDRLRALVAELNASGATVAAYGATAKGATLLNFCGLTANDISACADSTKIKQGRFIPGAGVPIVSEETLFTNPPDYFLLTAWNYKDELIAKVRASGANDVRFIVPIPDVSIVG